MTKFKKSLLTGAIAFLTLVNSAQAQLQPAPSTTKGQTISFSLANRLARLAEARATDNAQVNQPMSIPAWTASTVYSTGEMVQASGPLYFEQQAGPFCNSSAAGSGPTSASAAMFLEGTCQWLQVFPAPTGNAPTLVSAIQWAINTVVPAGGVIYNQVGSGATSTVTFYKTTLGGTTAASGTGPTGTTTSVDNTITWTFVSTAPGFFPGLAGANPYIYNTNTGQLLSGAKLYGGTVTGSGTGLVLNSGTLAGTFNQVSLQRVEFVTDAPKITVGTFSNGNGVNSYYRVIVCNPNGANCHYASSNHIGTFASNGALTLIDFSAVGGRQSRTIIFEFATGTFYGFYVGPTDSVWPPSHAQLSMLWTGDSYPRGNGVVWPMFAYPQMVGDILGVSNVIDTSIPACGYETGDCASHGALSRLTDVTGVGGIGGNNGAVPDIVVDSNGTVDLQNFSIPVATIVADMNALHSAIRATPGMASTLYVKAGVYAHNLGGTGCTTCVTLENAEAVAVAAWNDPNALYCPWTTDPAGAWETGSGGVMAWSGQASFATNQMTIVSGGGNLVSGQIVTAAGVAGGTTISSGTTSPFTLSTTPGTIAQEAAAATLQNGNGNIDNGWTGNVNGHENFRMNTVFANRTAMCIRKALINAKN